VKQGNLFSKIEDYSCITEITKEEIIVFDNEFGETCALFVLDSTGFTRITREKGNLYFLFFVKTLRQKCIEVFAESNVIDYRFHADNVFAEFPDVKSALECAEIIHDYFEKEKFMMNADEYFQSCIGIGYGRVVRCDVEGVFGDEMNTTCKLGEDVASAGETLLTENAYRCVDIADHKVSVDSVKVSGVDINFYKLTF
jgi:adenylate cyclase